MREPATSEHSNENQGANDALARETRKVLRQRGSRGRDWSMSSAEIFTGVNRATIYNMRRGLKSVKLAKILQFARAVAPKGQEDAVEQRWFQIAARGQSDLPEVDYTYHPSLSSGEHHGETLGPREVTDPRLIEALDNLEKLPEPFFDSIIQTIREAANFACSRGSRSRSRNDEPLAIAAP